MAARVSPSDLAALARAAWRPERPDRMLRAALAMAWAGPTMAGALAAAAARYPSATAIVDDEGSLTFARLWSATDGVAHLLRSREVDQRSHVGLLHRNQRGFVVGMIAAAKVGADVVYLNTGFAAPQLADVVAAEGIDVLLYDDSFIDVVRDCDVRVAVSGGEQAAHARERARPFTPSRRTGESVILTSGTTGRPKGARRSAASASAGGAAALLSVLPIRARHTVVIAAPLFHAWGLAHLGLSLGLSSTVVMMPQFDPEATLAAVAAHRADGLVVVPVMLQRMIALGTDVLRRYDTSSLRYIASSGSALGAPLASGVLREFGPILYNVYGSTEVSLATIATPRDLLAAPATAGRPVSGATVRLLDDAGRSVARGAVGRVFVGSASRFDGYTGGGTKASVDGLLSSGDLGHVDDAGRLFIDGREDDMIVSGGENVFPAEVEELIAGHHAVAEAAVIGVPDDAFGQRLKAFVVRAAGAALTADEVRAYVRERLARHKVPRDVVFLDVLPRTTTGKLRRVELT